MECKNCGAEGPAEDTEAKAEAAWSRREPPADIALLSLLADIRAAAGDPTAKLMQSELVELIAALRADAERWDRTRAPRGDGPCPLLWMTDTDNTVFGDPLTGIHADAAIDAARAAK